MRSNGRERRGGNRRQPRWSEAGVAEAGVMERPVVVDEFENDHILALAAELSDGVAISSAEATKVLGLLELAPLLESINAARGFMSNPANLLVLGIPRRATAQAVDDCRTFELRLENLRLSTRIAPRLQAAPEDRAGIDVCKVSLLVRNTTVPGTWTFGHDPAKVRKKLPRAALTDPGSRSRPPDLTSGDVRRVGAELAARLGLSRSQGRKLLERLGVALLIKDINTARQIISDPDALSALGLSADAIGRAVEDSASFEFKLDSLRLTIRKGSLVGSPAFLQKLMASTRSEMLETSRKILALSSP